MICHLKRAAAPLLAFGCVVGTAPTAFGQERGARLGAFVVTPSAVATTGYSDNYLRSPDIDEGSFFGRFAPSVSIASDWSRHALVLSLGADLIGFTADQDDNLVNTDARAQFALDLTRSFQVKIEGGHGLRSEGRGNDDAPFGSEGSTIFNTFDAGVEARYKAGRVRIQPSASVTFQRYMDTDLIGAPEANNSDRDLMRLDYGVEVGYEYLRGYEVFAQAYGVTTDYLNSVDDNGFDRDSQSVGGLLGMQFSVTRLIEGRAAVGYAFRMHDDAAFSDASAVDVEVGLDWSATPLMLVHVEGFQRFDETTTFGSSSTSSLGGRARVEHSLREDVTLSPFLGFTHKDFEDTSRVDNLFEIGLGVGYEVSRYFVIGADYGFTFEDSTEVGDYIENRVSIGVTAQY